jgi:hypothetical protein
VYGHYARWAAQLDSKASPWTKLKRLTTATKPTRLALSRQSNRTRVCLLLEQEQTLVSTGAECIGSLMTEGSIKICRRIEVAKTPENELLKFWSGAALRIRNRDR